MNEIIRHGRDVDEAVSNALAELRVSRDEVKIEVLDEGARGLLGIIGQREASVRVVVDWNKANYAAEYLQTVLGHIDPGAQVDFSEDEQFILCDIQGERLGLIIGRHGETLNALQYLVNVAASRGSMSDRRSIVLDAGNYRTRRRKDVGALAERMARRAIRNGYPVRLDPMPPHERKIVHTTLQDNPQVSTESEGMDPQRCVVITPASRKESS